MGREDSAGAGYFRLTYFYAVQLSVVIVSYNVRHFLEQCLESVARAARGLAVEVFVVDNNSADGSVAMVARRFPDVHLIANPDNPGFARANNQAIKLARGEYVLLLNPDTVVSEATFRKCLEFSDAHPDLGGLGVKMIDGSGRFLPESKRGMPTPWVAFTKAFGLARLFPHSRRFGHYHLGYLSKDETHAVEVLSGAFMWMSSGALTQVQGLDETFFMYGEDIDLSYRLLRAGYRNYYYPDTSIIHYKGESTKRGSLNYVRVFYQAMIIFARKHYGGPQARLWIAGMRAAVYARGLLTLMGNLWRRLRFPLLDAVGIYGGLYLLKRLWGSYHFGDVAYFPTYVDYLHFPAYTLLWVGGIFLGGGYDRPGDRGRLLRSLGVATLILLAIYGLLPEILRPSRALVVLGAAWAVSWTLLLRTLTTTRGEDRLLIVGGHAETERALSLLQKVGAHRQYLGRVGPAGAAAGTVGRSERLPSLVRLYRATEIIFCAADLDHSRIQSWMTEIGPRLEYRILPEHSDSLIGSHRSDRRGSLYTIDVNLRLGSPTGRRAKWLLDKVVALLLLLLAPLLIWFVRLPGGYLLACWRVLRGWRTWVGYHPAGAAGYDRLPPLPPGITWPGADGEVDEETAAHLNFLYARDYGVGEDLRILIGDKRWGR